MLQVTLQNCVVGIPQQRKHHGSVISDARIWPGTPHSLRCNTQLHARVAACRVCCDYCHVFLETSADRQCLQVEKWANLASAPKLLSLQAAMWLGGKKQRWCGPCRSQRLQRHPQRWQRCPHSSSGSCGSLVSHRSKCLRCHTQRVTSLCAHQGTNGVRMHSESIARIRSTLLVRCWCPGPGGIAKGSERTHLDKLSCRLRTQASANS